ncbi:cytidylate kinase-like family protein [Enterocloster citroniae]|uniref:cytidylate kinase-like family protein n=1 Tax=Enterocloster citroniae TaxID=358743 RepID=UPI00349EC365
MKNRIITISREFGSGGRTIGKMTAETLGIPCYDQELIEKLSEDSGFTEDYIREQDESSAHKGWFANAFSGRSLNGVSNQDYLWIIQRSIILELAARESCVIVGRLTTLSGQGACVPLSTEGTFNL